MAALKLSPYLIHSTDYYFLSFDFSKGILRNQKISLGLDSFSHHCLNIFGPYLVFASLCSNNAVEKCKITVILLGCILPNL